jgi:hypothetical protein
MAKMLKIQTGFAFERSGSFAVPISDYERWNAARREAHVAVWVLEWIQSQRVGGYLVSNNGLMNYFPAIKLFYVERPAIKHITRDVWILLWIKVVIPSLFFSVFMTHLSLSIVSFHWHL